MKTKRLGKNRLSRVAKGKEQKKKQQIRRAPCNQEVAKKHPKKQSRSGNRPFIHLEEAKDDNHGPIVRPTKKTAGHRIWQREQCQVVLPPELFRRVATSSTAVCCKTSKSSAGFNIQHDAKLPVTHASITPALLVPKAGLHAAAAWAGCRLARLPKKAR